MIARRSLTLAEFFDSIYKPKKLSRRKPRTIAIYGGVMERFTEYLARSPLVTDLTEEHLEGFIGWRFNQGRAAHTVDKERDKLMALANFAARKRYIEEFPDVEPIELPEEPPIAMKLDQIQAFVDSAKYEHEIISTVYAPLWWEALIKTVLGTGERTEATLRFRWDLVDLKEGWIRSPGSARKGGRKGMTYPITGVVVDALRAIRRDRDLVFENPWKAIGTLYRRFDRIAERAHLPVGREWKFQCMRRSHASYYQRNGGDATKKLGHDSPKTAKESYLDPTIAEDSDLIRGRLPELRYGIT